MVVIKKKKKKFILVSPKQLERMVDWYDMSCNSGENDITEKDRKLANKVWDILDKVKEEDDN